jgi:hypothetical protein
MPSTISSIADLRAELGVATRLSGADSPRTLEARRALAAAVLEKRVREVVRSAPPLTDEQRERIVRALGSGPRFVGKLVDDPLHKEGSTNIPNQLGKTGAAVTR